MESSAQSEIAALEREWMAAWISRDRAVCDRILGDDFILTSARGTLMSKLEWLAGAMGPIVGQSFDWDELQVRLFGDAAIVHARTRQSASVAGQDWSGQFLLTDVWVRRAGRWQVVSRHGTGPLSESVQL
jgi:ketosteroid isomerase-like protein